MSIGNALQKGSWVHVYDDRGRQIATIGAGTGKGDGLTGYTSSTVNIKKGSWIHTYDEKGRQISTTSAR